MTEQIFSPDEIKEIISMAKKAASGELPPKDVMAYCAALERAIYQKELEARKVVPMPNRSVVPYKD